ncbi:uncharacterized protein LOC132188690 [Corylus avellana]|uniref:uncharacterized protein LOC132188690 n=1 Tax=Corylus avellana TaxID=13451 RepID=UPI001E22B809|nr:uncharacterized protein LOC132188690 [Corylus avellana]
MAWSAENATKAYIRALKMAKIGKEPDVAEFISALVAGNNAQLMAMICPSIAGSTALALVAAAHQTGGRVVCILSGLNELHASKKALGPYANCVEFAVGDARTLLLDDYKGADFVLIDCHINEHKGVFFAAKKNAKHDGALIVGYNALHKGSWWSELNTHFLPIGEGLLVTRIAATNAASGSLKRSRWLVKVDKCTGEEHVFRITSPQRKQIEA